MKFIPHDYQKFCIDYIKAHPISALFLDMGLGKSIITLTAISSFVVPSLREPMSILRILMIVLVGMLGLYGILLAAALLGVNICAVTAYGMPYTAPLAPFTGEAMRDTLVRVGFPRMQRRWTLLSQLKGSTMNPPEDRP